MDLKYFKVLEDVYLRMGPGKDFAIAQTLTQDMVVKTVDVTNFLPVLVMDEDGQKGIYFSLAQCFMQVEAPPPTPAPPVEVISSQSFLDLAYTKEGQDYVLGANAPFEDPNYNGPWDCAEFVSWVVYQVTGKVYGCVNNKAPIEQVDAYTGGWAADIKSGRVKGISLELAYNTPGAILLRYYGKSGHIVFSDGEGGTIEAMGSDYGVCRGKSRGRDWTNGILIPGVKYS